MCVLHSLATIPFLRIMVTDCKTLDRHETMSPRISLSIIVSGIRKSPHQSKNSCRVSVAPSLRLNTHTASKTEESHSAALASNMQQPFYTTSLPLRDLLPQSEPLVSSATVSLACICMCLGLSPQLRKEPGSVRVADVGWAVDASVRQRAVSAITVAPKLLTQPLELLSQHRSK